MLKKRFTSDDEYSEDTHPFKQGSVDDSYSEPSIDALCSRKKDPQVTPVTRRTRRRRTSEQRHYLCDTRKDKEPGC